MILAAFLIFSMITNGTQITMAITVIMATMAIMAIMVIKMGKQEIEQEIGKMNRVSGICG